MVELGKKWWLAGGTGRSIRESIGTTAAGSLYRTHTICGILKVGRFPILHTIIILLLATFSHQFSPYLSKLQRTKHKTLIPFAFFEFSHLFDSNSPGILSKQITMNAKVAELEAKMAAMEAEMAELKRNECKKREKEKFRELQNRLDAQFREAVLEGLPQLALEMDALHTEFEAIAINPSELPKPDARMIQLITETKETTQTGISTISLIVCRIQQLSSDVPEGSVLGEVLRHSLKHADELSKDLDDLKKQLGQFHKERSYHVDKMHTVYGSDVLAEYDRCFLDTVKGHLEKARNRSTIALHKILAQNLNTLLTRENPAAGAQHSLYHT